MSDPRTPLPDEPDETISGSPHSAGSVALRVLAALAVVAVAFAVERLWLDEATPKNTYGAKVHKIDVDSDLLDRTLPVSVVVPRRIPDRQRGLLVFLHGRGEDERSYLVDPMFEALGDLRDRAPVVAFPYGGASSYWHNRESGQWAAYVIGELIPKLIRRYDIAPRKIAIGGISMGGFGAYAIARLSPKRFCAIGGHSPAIWESAAETADGAFDDAADFDRNDIIEAARLDPSPYRGTRLWIDAGGDDPFLAGDQAFEDALRESGLDPVVRDGPGGHDSEYWNGNWREYLGFYARALNRCRLATRTTGARDPACDPAPLRAAAGRPRPRPPERGAQAAHAGAGADRLSVVSAGGPKPSSRARRRAGAGAVAAAAIAIAAAGGAVAVAGGPAVPLADSEQAAAIIGTRGPDTLRGGKWPDLIVGRARGDRLFGGRSFDRLRGGRGSDRLIGQGQGALMVGGSGRDQFNMRNGRRIQGAGRDVIRARDGTPDQINCGPGPSDVAYVDRVEDGVYDCERIVTPDGAAATRAGR